MPEIREQVSEALERTEDEGDGHDDREKDERNRLNSIVATSVAVVAMGFATFGLVIGLAGFFGWNLRPEWLAQIIDA